MQKKRETKKRTSRFKPVFTNAEHKLMQNYGVGSLIDEVGVNRVMIVRTLDKMNQEMENLSFRDHLDAMRAISYTTGRIAALLDTRERLYQPYLEEKKRYDEAMHQVNKIVTDFAIQSLGEEKWDEIQIGVLEELLNDELKKKGRNGS